MNIDEMIMVSVDDHVVEPPHLFDGRLPAKYADLAPQFVTREDGTNAWRYEGQEIANVALNAVVGAAAGGVRHGADLVRGDPRAAAGTSTSASRTWTPTASSGRSASRRSRSSAASCSPAPRTRTSRSPWCRPTTTGTSTSGAAPTRAASSRCVLPAIWDPEVCAAEVRRTAAKGAHAVTFSENPSKLGWPSIHSDHWDPFWTACSDENVVVCMHIGSSSQLVITAPDAPIDCLITLTPMNIVQAAADLVWSHVLRKFPRLNIALSEGGIGWIPYFLERVDYNYERHHRWTGQDFGDQRPSEVFNEHVITCFIDDHFGVASREFLNMDRVCWECDYPHSDSTWPDGAGDPGQAARRRVRPRHRPHHSPERDAAVQLRPVQRAAPRGVHRGCPAPAGGWPRRERPLHQPVARGRPQGAGHRPGSAPLIVVFFAGTVATAANPANNTREGLATPPLRTPTGGRPRRHSAGAPRRHLGSAARAGRSPARRRSRRSGRPRRRPRACRRW